MASSSSRLKRSSSLGRLAADDDDYRYKMAIEKLRCDLVGFPYCCNKHYSVYRRPSYYADLDYPYNHRWYDRGLRYPDWPYSGSSYHRRPWYYDDYYRDYARGYEEGLQKYDSKIRRSASSADLLTAADDEAAMGASVSKMSIQPATARPLSTTPLPAPLPSYYDRYHPSYWYNHHYHHSDYYYRQPYYWRRYLDSRAY